MSWRLCAGIFGFAAWMGSELFAGPIAVPNASFELPETSFVSVAVDAWQKAPKPDWYSEGGGFSWAQLIGIFKNTSPASPDHIDNCDGTQAVWLFAVPEVALFQDYDSMDADDAEPTHAFDVTYDPGKSYRLTVGVVGTGGGMQQGATLELSLYYRNGAGNKVALALTTITNTVDVFTNNTRLIDFTVSIPAVNHSDPWAGKHIGIQMRSTVATNLQGGYWDLDHVRLVGSEQPKLTDPMSKDGQFQFALQSEPGETVEILSAANVALPVESWASEAIVTNTAGNMTYTRKASDAARFYRALPANR